MESTSTSWVSRWAAASGWRAFQRSSPASASSFFAARADLDERLERDAGRPGVGSALAPRRLDARRLAGLLGVVRRPGRVALAFGLLAGRQLQQRLERPRARVDAGVPVAHGSEARGHGAERELLGPAPRRARPRSRAPRPARRASAAPSRRRRRCGPSRSGCSRGRRRGAPPSTTCWWRARAPAARPPAPGRAPRAAPARTTSGDGCAR